MEEIANLFHGFATVLQPFNLLVMLVGIMLGVLIGVLPGLGGVRPYLLTEQFNAWQGLLREPIDTAPIAHAAWVCPLYALPALAIAYLVFLRRDVAGG